MSKVVRFDRREQAERFAAAVDDDANSSGGFEGELSIVQLLRDAGSGTVLDDESRERILNKINNPEAAAAPTRKRRFPVSAAAAAVLVAAGAIGVQASQGALPGDMLYDVKRAAESLTLDLTFTDNGKVTKHLQDANERLTELDAMRARDASDGGVDSQEAQEYQSTLADFNSSVTAASSQVTTDAVSQGGAGLRSLRSWSIQHRQRLAHMAPQLPDAVGNSVNQSVTLLGDIAGRADKLLQRVPCDPVSDGSDHLGAKPADTFCDASTPRPATLTKDRRAPSTHKAHEHHKSDGAHATETTSTAPSHESTSTSEPQSGGGHQTTLPTIPHVTSTPKLPVQTTTPPTSTSPLHHPTLPTGSLHLPVPTLPHLHGLG